jgi:hypothetical protein
MFISSTIKTTQQHSIDLIIFFRHQRRSRNNQSPRCHGSAESSGNGTIFQTVSSGNVGSLESLARWIGSDTFQTAGSESAEMAVILSSVECPVCYEAIWPPKKIFQCTKGHILCETCLGNPYFDQVCSVQEILFYCALKTFLESLSKALIPS